MYLNHASKQISELMRRNARRIRPRIQGAFDASIVACPRELQFFRALIRNMTAQLNQMLVPGLRISCRSAEIHAKPIVRTNNYRRELGDLLIVVTYCPLLAAIEKKAVIYQVKLTQTPNTTICDIDGSQLDLLMNWPAFQFGRQPNGNPINYHVRALSLEFGSYMLEPRSAIRGLFRTNHSFCYGMCPNASTVFHQATGAIDIDQLIYVRGDCQAMFSQLLFETGEHLSNLTAEELVNSLYRLVGLAPDPPDEFAEYSETGGDDGFAVLEINIVQTEESAMNA